MIKLVETISNLAPGVNSKAQAASFGEMFDEHIVAPKIEWKRVALYDVYIMRVGNHAIGRVYMPDNDDIWWYEYWKYVMPESDLNRQFSMEHRGEEGLEKTKEHMERQFNKWWRSFK